MYQTCIVLKKNNQRENDFFFSENFHNKLLKNIMFLVNYFFKVCQNNSQVEFKNEKTPLGNAKMVNQFIS